MTFPLAAFFLGERDEQQMDMNRELAFIHELPNCVKEIWSNQDKETTDIFKGLLHSGRSPAQVAELFVYYVAGQANITRLTL